MGQEVADRRRFSKKSRRSGRSGQRTRPGKQKPRKLFTCRALGNMVAGEGFEPSKA